MKFFTWSTAFCSAETGTLGKADKKCLESLKMCCSGWRRAFGPIVCKNKNYDAESREERIIHTIERRKTNWSGYTLRRNCLVTHASKKTYKGG